MMMQRISQFNSDAYRGAAERRGNSLVLVAAILVLLVIIATAYVTRTQTQRQTTSAQQSSQQREENIGAIAEALAEETALALFAHPIDAAGFDPGTVVDSNWPRLQPPPNAHRYGVDIDRDLDRFFPYNVAPFHTVPFTNWPSPDTNDGGPLETLNPRFWPSGPGNVDPENDLPAGQEPGDGGGNNAIAALLSAESNPLGNPGFGDNRWLSDYEPLRYFSTDDAFNAGIHDAFSHWRHMSYIARPNNGWRLVADISNVMDNLVTNLNIPVEQWLAYPDPYDFFPISDVTGTSVFTSESEFWQRWNNWFGFENGLASYNEALLFAPPPNLYRLSDLNGTAVIHQEGDRPEDEFIPGTRRNHVSRVLADARGDGFTDSFWFLSPFSVKDGVRQVVAVSIVDNSAKINANVATRFLRNDTDFGMGFRSKTRGHTPADIALIGQGFDIDPAQLQTLQDMSNAIAGTWNVGFYDNPANWRMWPAGNDIFNPMFLGYRVNPNQEANNRWFDHVRDLGISIDGDPILIPSALDRLTFWREAARHGLDDHTADAWSPTPFALADELELRMFHGNNNPWLFSRYEHSVQAAGEEPQYAFLRANTSFSESSEYREQLDNRNLLLDNRRKITMYSGARNDLMPPVTWWEKRGEPDQVPLWVPANIAMNPFAAPDTVEYFAFRRFLNQARRKLDLREPEFLDGNLVVGRYYNYIYDDTEGALVPAGGTFDESKFGRLNLRDRLAPTLLAALSDGPMANFRSTALTDAISDYRTYFGDYVNDGTTDGYGGGESAINNTRRLAAGYAANILAYRTNERQTLADTIPLPAVGIDTAGGFGGDATQFVEQGQLRPNETERYRYLGMDKQPFLVEAFIGHVYRGRTIPENYYETDDPDDCGLLPPAGEYTNSGNSVVVYDSGGEADRSTIVVVQIANPYDTPIDLREYRIDVFGQEYRIGQGENSPVWLYPAWEEQPSTAIFYAIRESVGGDEISSDDFGWLRFLGFEEETNLDSDGYVQVGSERMAPRTLIRRVEGQWAVESRDLYDDSESDAVRLMRWLPYAHEFDVDPDGGDGAWVVVDRIDPPNVPDEDSFRVAVNQMGEYKPQQLEPGQFITAECSNVPPEGGASGPFNIGYDLGSGKNHWVQWVRATRAWGMDLNNNGRYDAHERAPRYVFGDRAVVSAAERFPDDGAIQDDTFIQGKNHEDGTVLDDVGGNAYQFEGPGSNPWDEPWFHRAYYSYTNERLLGPLPDEPDAPPARPTFFTLGYHLIEEDGIALEDFIPDKGWYGQYSVDGGQLDGIGGRDGVDDPVIASDGGVEIPLFSFPYSMRMTGKNKHYPLTNDLLGTEAERPRDFEQVGELLNVWLFGHELRFSTGSVENYDQTTRTFSEYMSSAFGELSGFRSTFADGTTYTRWRREQHGRRVNRLHMTPVDMGEGDIVGAIISRPEPPGPGTSDDDIALYYEDSRHAYPALPAGVRVLELFVCDGPGRVPGDDEYGRFSNADNFSGRITPGLINLNTAPPEVLRALPHMTRAVHEHPSMPLSENPFVRMTEALVQYRERLGAPDLPASALPGAELARPDYAHRGRDRDWFAAPDDGVPAYLRGMRGERGVAAIGEVNLLTRSGRRGKDFDPGSNEYRYVGGFGAGDIFGVIDQNSSWRADYATMPDRTKYRFDLGLAADTVPNVYLYPHPADTTVPLGAHISTMPTMLANPDIPNTNGYPAGLHPEHIAEDMTEANLLASGISNMVSARSDVFTVYFRVRTFRQNPVTGVWDATDPEHILDDRRYVMLVDRSEVNRPADKPKILYMEPLPK